MWMTHLQFLIFMHYSVSFLLHPPNLCVQIIAFLLQLIHSVQQTLSQPFFSHWKNLWDVNQVHAFMTTKQLQEKKAIPTVTTPSFLPSSLSLLPQEGEKNHRALIIIALFGQAWSYCTAFLYLSCVCVWRMNASTRRKNCCCNETSTHIGREERKVWRCGCRCLSCLWGGWCCWRLWERLPLFDFAPARTRKQNRRQNNFCAFPNSCDIRKNARCTGTNLKM